MSYFCVYTTKGGDPSRQPYVVQADLETIYHLHNREEITNIETHRVVKDREGFSLLKVKVDVWYDYMTILNTFGTIIDHYKHEEE